MADHPEITPEELKTAAEVFLATGSYTKAAEAIGRDRAGVARALKRADDGLVRSRVYARALDEAFVKVASEVAHTATELRRDAKRTKKSGERANVAFALNDAARTLNAMRTSHAKLTGTHAPEKHQHHIDVTKLPDDALDAELHAFATRGADAGGEGAVGAAPAGEGATGGGTRDDTDDEGEATEP